MEKKVKCQKKFCRNTPDKTTGIIHDGKWLCDPCWSELCRQEELEYEKKKLELPITLGVQNGSS
jgi:hypothetical protein